MADEAINQHKKLAMGKPLQGASSASSSKVKDSKSAKPKAGSSTAKNY